MIVHNNDTNGNFWLDIETAPTVSVMKMNTKMKVMTGSTMCLTAQTPYTPICTFGWMNSRIGCQFSLMVQPGRSEMRDEYPDQHPNRQTNQR